jgi:PAS domain S-box-containing protein
MVNRTRTGVFHGPQAMDSPFIPAQADFVVPYRVESVVGFGDVLPDGNLFAVILFSKIPIPQQSASLFTHLSLSTKAALIRYLSMADGNTLERVSSLESLLTNYEEVVLEQNELLLLAEQQMRSIVEAAPTGMVMIDESGKIVLVNAMLEQTFAYDREELLGQPIELLIPERFHDRHPGMRDSYLATPAARSMGEGRDLFGLRKNGAELPVEIGLNPIRNQQGSYVLASVNDISIRRQYAEELARAKEAAVLPE